MMIKEVAEEVGVHPSTVSRAVANKYAHTPQGVFELRYFFSEAIPSQAGSLTSLINLKRLVKKMIEEEEALHPLTDEQITHRLREVGYCVTRRTVAKYREDMRIPSTHQRRVKAVRSRDTGNGIRARGEIRVILNFQSLNNSAAHCPSLSIRALHSEYIIQNWVSSRVPFPVSLP